MKTAVVLSGGGAKGSVQFGMLKYLVEQGLQPDAIYGTSVGSLNAAGYSHVGMDGLEDFWESIKARKDVFKFNWKTLIFLSQGVFHAGPLRKLVVAATVGKTPTIPCFACSVNLATGEVVYTEARDPAYVDQVLASSSVPGLCEPVGEYVDGGIRECTPLKKAIDDGADRIVVIMCSPFTPNPAPGKISNWIMNIIRTTDILGHEIYLEDIRSCIWYNNNSIAGKRKIQLEVYAPAMDVLSTQDFTQDKIQPGIVYGYEQAKKGPIIKD